MSHDSLTAGRATLRAGEAVPAREFADLRREMLLRGCKWDPQVGDEATLAPFPLLLARSAWRQLAAWTEQLARELMEAEAELLARPDLHRTLGVPARIRRALREAGGKNNAAPRILRFDFHPLVGGDWRISEVNSDVPGGFTEASTFPRLMAPQHPGAVPAGDPAAAWANALARCAGAGGVVALLAAPGHLEDQQIVAFLAKLLRDRGIVAHPAEPRLLRWRDGRAFLEAAWHRGPLDLVVRFFQAEWCATLPEECGRRHFFAGAVTPVANTGAAVLTENKRFPLAWPALRAPLTLWRELLPESRDPRHAPWPESDWLLKRAYSNTGDAVCHRAWMSPAAWRRVAWEARLLPRRWVAQRRFDTTPLATPRGPRFPCLGVYAIDGRACGIYARLGAGPVVNYEATDAAVLIEED
ncbi:MAG TPA: glutathionylspermidine synthase family protein [Chthoniobacteraceae bacterium]|jgi:hypothetical protein|nr:glutathionylspermidine synthase family protein [Chthoniobacteraceae bacterium]